MTRNRLLTLAKSLPVPLLARHARRLLWGQIYFLVAYRRPWASMLGGLDFLFAGRHLWRERRAFRGLRRLSSSAIDRLLDRDLNEPPLRALLSRKLSGSSSAP
jgi:hypothetical protein